MIRLMYSFVSNSRAMPRRARFEGMEAVQLRLEGILLSRACRGLVDARLSTPTRGSGEHVWTTSLLGQRFARRIRVWGRLVARHRGRTDRTLVLDHPLLLNHRIRDLG